MDNIENMTLLSQTGLKEKIILGTAFASFIASVFLLIFFDTLFFKPLIHPDDVVGKLSGKSGTVQRRTPDMFEYLEISVKDPVGNGDSIVTGKGSNSLIELMEGSKLRLGPESLIVIRMRDGKFNIKIEKGEVSGEIDKDSEIEFQTEEESMTIKGDEFRKITMQYMPDFGLSIDEVEATKLKLQSSETRDSGKNKSQKDPQNKKSKLSERKLYKADSPPDFSKQKILKENKKIRTYSSKDEPETLEKAPYNAPYPQLGQLILRKKSTRIILLPKNLCKTSCEVVVEANSQIVQKRQFNGNKVPLLSFEIAKEFSGPVTWKVTEGSAAISGSFRVKPFSEEAFADALRRKQNIEVVD